MAYIKHIYKISFNDIEAIMRKNKLHIFIVITTSIFFLNLIVFSGCVKITDKEVSKVEEKESFVEEVEEKEAKVISPQEMALILAEEEIPELDLADQAVRFGYLEPTVARTVSGSPISYQVGDIVSYNGQTWKCVFAHTSQSNWYPGAPGIWF